VVVRFIRPPIAAPSSLWGASRLLALSLSVLRSRSLLSRSIITLNLSERFALARSQVLMFRLAPLAWIATTSASLQSVAAKSPRFARRWKARYRAGERLRPLATFVPVTSPALRPHSSRRHSACFHSAAQPDVILHAQHSSFVAALRVQYNAVLGDSVPHASRRHAECLPTCRCRACHDPCLRMGGSKGPQPLACPSALLK
jgi:hypothetical protein